jgi:hypothetical protein
LIDWLFRNPIAIAAIFAHYAESTTCSGCTTHKGIGSNANNETESHVAPATGTGITYGLYDNDTRTETVATAA